MKAIFSLSVLLFISSITSLTFAGDIDALVSPSRPIDVDAKFEEEYFKTQPWINEFRYVIIVNKAETGTEAQSIKIYEYGKIIRTSKVSTGRDGFEQKGEHHSKRDSWSVTPTGYYTPSFIDKNHRSSAYGRIFSRGTLMPYAIFFNGDIALHQAPEGTEDMLGTKASGGCVRLLESVASDLFTRVQETEGAKIPSFTVNGEPLLDNLGHLIYNQKPGFSALVIVLKKII